MRKQKSNRERRHGPRRHSQIKKQALCKTGAKKMHTDNKHFSERAGTEGKTEKTYAQAKETHRHEALLKDINM